MRVHFDRIGRTHDVEPLSVADDATADTVAEAVYRYARPHLMSAGLDVWVDLEGARGGIVVGGFRSAGTFTVEAATLTRAHESPDARGDS